MARPEWLPQRGASLRAFLPTRLRFPLIEAALDARLGAAENVFGGGDGYVGWSDKALARAARKLAGTRRLPFWTLEDGFLRSVGLGKTGAPPVSIIADDLGIYFDAGAPSRLEELINESTSWNDVSRACDFRHHVVEQRLTKYNHLPDRAPAFSSSASRRRILLVDQVRGDSSVAGSGATEETFRLMYDAAASVPHATVIIRTHPDVSAGLAAGYLRNLPYRPNAIVCDETISPHALLDVVDEVWTVSSQLGYDALLRGMPVTTFGVPFYAGWGLTIDRAANACARRAFARRTGSPSIDQFAAATLLHYPRYVDPVKVAPTTPEQATERLIAWRRRALGLRGTYLCLGIARHKRHTVRRFLESPLSNVRFARSKSGNAAVRQADYLVRWGNDDPRAEGTLAPAPLLRLEDGFVRSSGLGSRLVPASSLCIDRDAVYFDATRQSGLEKLLLETDFQPALLARAGRLQQRILQLGITKYNLPAGPDIDYRRLAAGRRIILVAGQVPGDASLRYGLTNAIGNGDLLQNVRAQRPDDFIIFKEHPDIVAGRRGPPTPPAVLARLADLTVNDVRIEHLLHVCDEVHVATSQIGFEALLRQRPVWCHGLPFYSGWGLTVDHVTPLRPRRELSLEALIAGALIIYPHYISARTNLPCEVEDVIDEISSGGGPRRSLPRVLANRMGWSR
ncbi:capsular polysaccharide biosynthesis protein [Phyllobacterium sp. 0TCS1.6C]|uniref:capsular polysaccharide biosynthesis protein n=1 Tax=unclassified Phyllobacterium TaxID=2638441 RepID=UPI0022654822|nr:MULTISPECIES: capsular polysaccharide biosynthesis protein [unclassified Phyllobacterium]MCX8280284.1 capsular polysaccharide biosynthesis protein [Phyllobacterium sp. 0TCS1.6C]MCX8294155.1 capsular polysaccharide biosynthesis protein [Phyllobacterium sp. 0TCS1.6A]